MRGGKHGVARWGRRAPCRRAGCSPGAAPLSCRGGRRGEGRVLDDHEVLDGRHLIVCAKTPNTFGLASEEASIQRLWSRENGRSSLLEVTMYCRSSGAERLQ